jgi:hypothetical protein
MGDVNRRSKRIDTGSTDRTRSRCACSYRKSNPDVVLQFAKDRQTSAFWHGVLISRDRLANCCCQTRPRFDVGRAPICAAANLSEVDRTLLCRRQFPDPFAFEGRRRHWLDCLREQDLACRGNSRGSGSFVVARPWSLAARSSPAFASLLEAEMLESVVSLSAAFWSWLEWLMKMAGSYK